MSLPEIPPLEPMSVQRYPYNIAIIVDNVVRQILNVPGSQAAIFMAGPTFVQVDTSVQNGYIYNPEDGTFAPMLTEEV
jgi:hypothetical protein